MDSTILFIMILGGRMRNFKRLKTGVVTWESVTAEGITRVHADKLYNLKYKRNVFWTKIKNYLRTLNIY